MGGKKKGKGKGKGKGEKKVPEGSMTGEDVAEMIRNIYNNPIEEYPLE